MSNSPEAAVEAQKLAQQEKRTLEKQISTARLWAQFFTLVQAVSGLGLLYIATSLATNGILKDLGGNAVEHPVFSVTMFGIGFVISCWGRTEYLMDLTELVSQRKP